MATDPEERRRRVRRTAVILGLIALAFYVGYVALSMVNASHALAHRGTPPPTAAPY